MYGKKVWRGVIKRVGCEKCEGGWDALRGFGMVRIYDEVDVGDGTHRQKGFFLTDKNAHQKSFIT